MACARGVDDVDPVASSLMPFPLGGLVGATRRAQRAPSAFRYALQRTGVAAHLPLRTLAIDAVIADAILGGARQLVILGAGLDARAWRMTELADTVVFEVDHPATQRYKAARIGGRSPACRDLRLVDVDFAKDDLEARLRSAGHTTDAPSVFLWEGVTMYLPPAAIDGTLAAIARLSGRHGTLAMTYATPRLASAVGPLRPLVRAAFAVLGEPLLGLMSASEARARVTAAGFQVSSDTDARDWALAAGRPVPWGRIAERLLVVRT